MIVVAITGILAAVAIPAYTRYVRKARTVEAHQTVALLVKGALTYYASDIMTPSGLAPKQFPGPECDPEADKCGGPGNAAEELTAGPCGCHDGGKCPGGLEWNLPEVRQALKFHLPDPHNYKPLFARGGTGTDSWFGAVAIGDLDCDGEEAEFVRFGKVTSTGDLVMMPGVDIKRELE